MNTAPALVSACSQREPLTVTVKDALAMIGIGRTKFYAMMALGQITTITIGRRRLVHMASLKILASGLPSPPPPCPPVQLPLFEGEEDEKVRVLRGKSRRCCASTSTLAR